MPRGIGASVGVKDTVTGADAGHGPFGRRACSISGVCRCVPATEYADIDPITSLASRSGRGERPAPDVPEAATITMSDGSTRPAVSSGARARIAAVA